MFTLLAVVWVVPGACASFVAYSGTRSGAGFPTRLGNRRVFIVCCVLTVSGLVGNFVWLVGGLFAYSGWIWWQAGVGFLCMIIGFISGGLAGDSAVVHVEAERGERRGRLDC